MPYLIQFWIWSIPYGLDAFSKKTLVQGYLDNYMEKALNS